MWSETRQREYELRPPQGAVPVQHHSRPVRVQQSGRSFPRHRHLAACPVGAIQQDFRAPAQPSRRSKGSALLPRRRLGSVGQTKRVARLVSGYIS